jgi:hypothetical protein
LIAGPPWGGFTEKYHPVGTGFSTETGEVARAQPVRVIATVSRNAPTPRPIAC